MQPIGPLMHEHRLIERAVAVLGREMNRIRNSGELNPRILDHFVDFFRTYADLCHHGKEESVLFRELEKKPLTQEHKHMMDELIQEHVRGRQLVKALDRANREYVVAPRGETVQIIISTMNTLTNFYPQHIKKEDKQFFYPVMGYFDQEEMNAMLREYEQVEVQLLHEKYRDMVAFWEESPKSEPGAGGEHG